MSNIDDYLKGYCKKERVSPEEAKTHAIVKEVAKYYDDIETKKITMTKMNMRSNDADIGDCK